MDERILIMTLTSKSPLELDWIVGQGLLTPLTLHLSHQPPPPTSRANRSSYVKARMADHEEGSLAILGKPGQVS
jgi:hypothetical protein